MMRKQNNLLLLRRVSKNKNIYLVSFRDSYDSSELSSGPDVLSPTGFLNLLSHFLQEVHQLSWGKQEELQPWPCAFRVMEQSTIHKAC